MCDTMVTTMETLRETMNNARERGVAVGHFNVADSNQLWGAIHAALELQVPIIIGFSEGEQKFFGRKQAVAMVKSIRDEYDHPIYVNGDHTYSVENAKAVIDAGFDSVVFDGTKLAEDERIPATQEVVQYAKSIGSDIVIEGELGYIGSSSKQLSEVPDDVLKALLPTPEDARRFVTETGVDAFAPAVGNIHGALKGRKNPALDIELIRAIHEIVAVPLVLHGGSGIHFDDFRKAISAGMNVVHISTNLRVAYREGLEEGIAAHPDEVAPYKYMNEARDAVKELVLERLKLFNNL